MTDRERLKLAAKAAGIDVYWDEEKTQSMLRQVCGARWTEWNPLTDDGDALRLAVKLKMPIQFPDWTDVTRTWGSKDCLDAFDELHGTDPLAATRRAIVRAAAEIGRNMK